MKTEKARARRSRIRRAFLRLRFRLRGRPLERTGHGTAPPSRFCKNMEMSHKNIAPVSLDIIIRQVYNKAVRLKKALFAASGSCFRIQGCFSLFFCRRLPLSHKARGCSRSRCAVVFRCVYACVQKKHAVSGFSFLPCEAAVCFVRHFRLYRSVRSNRYES